MKPNRRAAAPHLLVTGNNLCQVCGPAGNEVTQVLKSMSAAPKIVWQTPRTFEEVFDAIRTLGKETGTEAVKATTEWPEQAGTRVQSIAAATKAPR